MEAPSNKQMKLRSPQGHWCRIETPTWRRPRSLTARRWADMDESLRDKSFEKATIIESGYAHGFEKREVRNIRFHIAPISGGGTYEAATFVERGKRKERKVELRRLVVVRGWEHPPLELFTEERSASYTVLRARFLSFSKELDEYLDSYLAELAPGLIIVDGRRRPRASASPLPPRSQETDRPFSSSDDVSDRTTGGPSRPTFLEGAVEAVVLDRYERDPVARSACLTHYGAGCRVCGTTMSDVYGDMGSGYIHVHHRVPLGDVGSEHEVDPIRDLIPVCPNCHSMLHKRNPPMTVEDLAAIVRGRQWSAAQPGVAD